MTTPDQYGMPMNFSSRNPQATRLPAMRMANAKIMKTDAAISTPRL